MKNIDISAIKALAIDLDGTVLLPDGSLGNRTIQCLKKIKAKGIQLILCTGRAIESSKRCYNAIGMDGPMVFFNGAEIAEVPKVTLHKLILLNLEVVDFCIDLARSMDIHFQFFFPPQHDNWEMLLIEKERAESEMYHKLTGIVPLVTDLKAAISVPELQGVIKAMFIAEPALLETVRLTMLDRFGSHIYSACSRATFLEIMNAGVSKGEGLKTVMGLRGLKPEEVIAFGDEENDLPMFAVAGFSAAPANAKEKVRQAAGCVFGSSAEEGFAAFLEEIFSV